jgi:hypothetical protein
MSDPTFIHESYDKSHFDYFAFVVDNEVAIVFPVRRAAMPDWAAAMASDPKVIKLSDDQKDVVISGWTWNGTSFNQPS